MMDAAGSGGLLATQTLDPGLDARQSCTHTGQGRTDMQSTGF